MSNRNETPMYKDLRRIVSYNIKKAASERGMTQIYIATETEIPKTTINGYFKGTSLPTPGNIEKIAKVFGVSKSDIDPRFKTEFPKSSANNPSNIVNISQQTVKIPVLGHIACGDPILAEENYGDYRTVLAEGLPSGRLVYLEAKGDSMSPTIPDGAMVLVRAQPDVENGEIAAVLVNGNEEATLKRVKKQDDMVILVPDNPSHEPIFVTKNNPAKIIGKAIRFEQNL